MKSKEIERLAKKIPVDRAVIDQARILTDAEAALEKSRKQQTAPVQPNIWRIIMRSRITRFSTAAVIMTAVILAAIHFAGSIGEAGKIWAAAIQNIEHVNSALMYEKRIFTCDGSEVPFLNSDAVRYYSSKYGAREDMYNTEGLLLYQVFWLIRENVRIKIFPPMEQYKRTELTEDERMVWGRSGFRAIVELLKAEKPTELGRKKVNGREAEGFEIRNSKILSVIPVRIDSGVARFWIDVDTSLPLRYEAEFVTSDKLVTSLTDGKPIRVEVAGHDLRWNVEIASDIFEPNIPRDYTVLKSDSDVSFEGQDLRDISKWILENVGEYEYLSKSRRGVTIVLRKQFLADIAVFRLQGEPKDVDDFYEKLDIYYGGSPTASGGHYTVIGPQMIRDVFELSTSCDVFALVARPKLKVKNGHKHLIRINDLGTAVLRTVQKYNEQHVDVSFSFFPSDRESADSTGQIQASIDIPSAKISQEEAVLYRFTSFGTPRGERGPDAHSGRIEKTVMILLRIEQE